MAWKSPISELKLPRKKSSRPPAWYTTSPRKRDLRTPETLVREMPWVTGPRWFSATNHQVSDGYSPKSDNLILKGSPPIKQTRGLLIQGWHYQLTFGNPSMFFWAMTSKIDCTIKMAIRKKSPEFAGPRYKKLIRPDMCSSLWPYGPMALWEPVVERLTLFCQTQGLNGGQGDSTGHWVLRITSSQKFSVSAPRVSQQTALNRTELDVKPGRSFYEPSSFALKIHAT